MGKGRESTQSTKSDQSIAKRENVLASVGIPVLSPFGLLRRFIEDIDRIGTPTESGWMPALVREGSTSQQQTASAAQPQASSPEPNAAALH